MATGLLTHAPVEWAIAVTGVCRPGGGSAESLWDGVAGLAGAMGAAGVV